MIRLVSKLGLLLGVNAALGVGLLVLIDAGRHYEQWQTDSVLLATPRNTEFDLVVLGSSRAKLYTRLKPNLECLERELDMRVLGMATPFGGGIVPAQMYLANFYERGNRVKNILLFLDPFVMFSRGPNEGHKFVHFEPFRLRFLWKMARHGFGHRRIMAYVRSKFSLDWLTQKPAEVGYHTRALTPDDLDPVRMQMRMNSLFPDGLNEANFKHYARSLEQFLDMAQRNNARVIIAFPPTLLGPDPGRPSVLALLEEYRRRYEFEFHDLTTAVVDPGLYSDYDHLNSMGVEHFVSRFLKPLLRASGYVAVADRDTGFPRKPPLCTSAPVPVSAKPAYSGVPGGARLL